MNRLSNIYEFLYEYREASIRIFQGPVEKKDQFETQFWLPRRSETSAVEAFLIVPCSDGVIAYGFSKSRMFDLKISIEEERNGIALASKTIPGTIDDLLIGFGLFPHRPFVKELDHSYRKPRIGFAAYHLRQSFLSPLRLSIFEEERERFPYWELDDYHYRRNDWFSVFAFGPGGNVPHPKMLASLYWRHLQVERNFGSFSEVKNLSKEFAYLLESSTREEELQLFLEDHPEVIVPDYIKSRPKFRLADEFVTDFVILGGDGYEFIEIERPDKPIFTKGGQISYEVTQAENQILEWQILIEKDHSFFERRLPGLYRPKFRLIYGRESELTEKQKQKLAARFVDIRFDTYDSICLRFQRTIENLQYEKRRSFT